MLRATARVVGEPVTLAELKAQSRVDQNAEDALLQMYISAARRDAEFRLGRATMNTTYALTSKSFEDPLPLRVPDVQSVVSVQYRRPDNSYTAMLPGQYLLNNRSPMEATLSPAAGAWPDVKKGPEAVFVEFVAGYGATAASVPENIKIWILMRAAAMVENRESIIVGQPVSLSPFHDGLLHAERVNLGL